MSRALGYRRLFRCSIGEHVWRDGQCRVCGAARRDDGTQRMAIENAIMDGIAGARRIAPGNIPADAEWVAVESLKIG